MLIEVDQNGNELNQPIKAKGMSVCECMSHHHESLRLICRMISLKMLTMCESVCLSSYQDDLQDDQPKNIYKLI